MILQLFFAFIVTASCLYSIEDEAINRAIQYSLAGQDEKAHDLLETLLTKAATQDERTVILYNLGTLALTHGHLREAELKFSSIEQDPARPFFTRCLMQNASLTFLLLAERDLELYKEGDTRINVSDQFSQHIDQAKERIAIARKMQAMISQEPAEHSILDEMELRIDALTSLWEDEVRKNTLVDQPSNTGIDTAFLEALLAFANDITVMASQNNSDPHLLESQKEALHNVLSFFYKKRFDGAVPDSFQSLQEQLAKSQTMLDLKENLSFLIYLVGIDRAETMKQNGMEAAVDEMYASSLLLGEAQTKKRLSYLKAGLREDEGNPMSSLLLKRIKELSPKEFTIYYQSTQQPTEELFSMLLSDSDAPSIIQEALLDKLKVEHNKNIHTIEKALQGNEERKKSIMNAFATYDEVAAARYTEKRLMQNGIGDKTLTLFLSAAAKSPWTELLKSIQMEPENPLALSAALLALHFMGSNIVGSEEEPSSRGVDFLSALIERETVLVRYIQAVTERMQIHYPQQGKTDYNEANRENNPAITTCTLAEKEIMGQLTMLSKQDVTAKNLMRPLIERYNTVLQKNRPFIQEEHRALAQDTLRALEQLQNERKQREKEKPLPEKESQNEKQAQKNTAANTQLQTQKTDPNSAIELIQKMQQQDKAFEPKRALHEGGQVEKPW